VTNVDHDVRGDMRAFLAENFLYLYPQTTVRDEDNFLDLGIIDSLGFVRLVEEIESRYGVIIEDVEITEENFGSIDAIANYVESKRAPA
jgi:acyl carrier protein